MKTVRINILIFLAFFLASLPLTAQTTYQVITKKVERTFPYQDGYEVNIEGEKAEVVIKTWKRNEIAIVLELRAKHPDKERAQRDLEAMQYQAERVKNKVYVRNYLSTREGAAQPEALLEAAYFIQVPEDCPVYLKNHFGVASISDLAAGLRVNSEFTKLGLDNIRGLVDVRTRFGDLEGSRLDGAVTINSRRSNVTLREIKGQYDITAQYGVLKIFADRNLIDLRIDADKSEVFLYNPDLSAFAYTIQAQSSDLSLPNELPFKFSDNNLALKKASFKPEQEYFANITITIRFGELVIK
jgi:hypothetical protein